MLRREPKFTNPSYKQWIEILASAEEPFGLSVLVAAAFVRIVTHSDFPGGPTPLPQALGAIETLLFLPNCRILNLCDCHWSLLKKFSEASDATVKKIGYVQHAAISLEYGATFVTRNKDFYASVPRNCGYSFWKLR